VTDFKLIFLLLPHTTTLSILRYLGDRHTVPYIFFYQQMMEGCDSTKIETVGDSPTDQLNDMFCCFNNIPYHIDRLLPEHQKSSKTDTSSIALTNNNINSTSGFSTPSIAESTLRLHGCLTFDSLSFPLRYSSPTLDDSTLHLHGCSTVDSFSFRFPFQRSSVEKVSCYEYYSHALACTATSIRECGLFTTSLDTLWYVYSYIYIQLSSNATTILLLLFFVLALLMPTTDLSPTPTSSIVSPSLHFSRNRSFTMTNYTSITQYSFSFAPHPTCGTFCAAMNNAYSEDFDPAVVATFFTDAARTQVVPDVIPIIRAAIIDTIMLSTTAPRPVVAPIVNIMALFGMFHRPPRKLLPLQMKQRQLSLVIHRITFL